MASFIHLPEWHVVLCRECEHCLVPGVLSRRRHLTKHPHYLSGFELDTTLSLIESFEDDWLQPESVSSCVPTEQVPGLKLHDGFRCLVCEDMPLSSASKDTLRKHLRHRHGLTWSEKQPSGQPVWMACKVQTFFIGSRNQHFFAIQPSTEPNLPASESPQAARSLFLSSVRLEMASKDAQQNVRINASIQKSDFLPWLNRTDVLSHLDGLLLEEVTASYTLPSGQSMNQSSEDFTLAFINSAVDNIFNETALWMKQGPECRLSYPQQVMLSHFRTTDAIAGRKLRAFDPNLSLETQEDYRRLWKQTIAYCSRVVFATSRFFTHPEAQPHTLVKPTSTQKQAWFLLITAAREGNVEEAQTHVLAFSHSLICHYTGRKRYRSPLLSFLAMLSVDARSGAWKSPGNFNHVLSGIIWCAQSLLFRASIEAMKAPEDEEELLTVEQHSFQRLQDDCQSFLDPAKETPLGEILGWRLYLFAASKADIAPNQAIWDRNGERVTYRGTQLRLNDINKLFAMEMARARRLLYEGLMFSNHHLPRLQASAFKDDTDASSPGWYFAKHPDNRALLQNREDDLLRTIEESDTLAALYLHLDNGSVCWNMNAIDQFIKQADEFLASLATLIHMSAGQPLRESELFSVRWKNEMDLRNIFLHDGRVMLYTKYHKGVQQTGMFKPNLRVLHETLGNMLVDYLVYVVPLLEIFLIKKGVEISAKLFATPGEAVWPSSKLSVSMKKACTRAQISALHLQNWRQITVSIVKTKFSETERVFFDLQAGEEEEADEADDDIRALHWQRNHSSRTANFAYANQHLFGLGSAWDGLVDRGRYASSLWHRLWDLDSTFALPASRRDDAEAPPFHGILPDTTARPSYTSAQLVDAMRTLYRDPAMQWKSLGQQKAMRLVMSKAEQIITILPTGGGKSLLFMLPTFLSPNRTTVVITPLVSLRIDLARRLQELSLDFKNWSPRTCDQTIPLLLVSCEQAATASFLAFATRLAVQGRLDRIVLDEAHLTITASSYRPDLVDLANLRAIETQFVYLTATLPPYRLPEFIRQNNLLNPKIVRASSNRNNIVYHVQRLPAAKDFIQACSAALQDLRRLANKATDKVIVYVRTYAAGRPLADALGCPVYFRNHPPSQEEKQERIKQWLHSPNPFLVATAALGAGFDYASVRIVAHIDAPYGLIDFAQESGRAGRDGNLAYSVVFLLDSWQMQAPAINVEQRALAAYLQKPVCRRAILSKFLDGQQESCSDGDAKCDLCGGIVEAPSTVGTKRDHTGQRIIAANRLHDQKVFDQLLKDLQWALHKFCLPCFLSGDTNQLGSHSLTDCHAGQDYIRDKRHLANPFWLPVGRVCFHCYLPNQICILSERGTDSNGHHRPCKYPDMVMPLCHAAFLHADDAIWPIDVDRTQFKDVRQFLRWCGEAAEFAGLHAIRGLAIAAHVLHQLHDMTINNDQVEFDLEFGPGFADSDLPF